MTAVIIMMIQIELQVPVSRSCWTMCLTWTRICAFRLTLFELYKRHLHRHLSMVRLGRLAHHSTTREASRPHEKPLVSGPHEKPLVHTRSFSTTLAAPTEEKFLVAFDRRLGRRLPPPPPPLPPHKRTHARVRMGGRANGAGGWLRGSSAPR